MATDSQGTITPPVEGTNILAASATITVTIESIAGENDGYTQSVVDSNGAVTKIPAISEHQMVRCSLPDGSLTHHQVQPDYSDLADKVLTAVKYKFGLTNIKITAPATIAVGETFIIGSI